MKTILGTMTFSDQVDKESSANMLSMFAQSGGTEVDTAFVYNKGKTELLLGELAVEGALNAFSIAGKANPWAEGGLSAPSVKHQLNTSLNRLNAQAVELFYLHAPDLETPIVDTLNAVMELHAEGKFKRFGLSNYAAWQVAEIVEICKREGWLLPTVYQGMYNALTRDVERELLACLHNYDIAFYVYNPLAGGMLTGKHSDVAALPENGRFATFDGYQDRYWKKSYFDVITAVTKTCRSNNIPTSEAALRWLVHHSSLRVPWAEHGVIVGASSLNHLEQNLAALKQGQLPEAIVSSFEEAWEAVKPSCIKYFRP